MTIGWVEEYVRDGEVVAGFEVNTLPRFRPEVVGYAAAALLLGAYFCKRFFP